MPPRPNFRCHVSEPDRPDRRFSRLVYAENEDAARRALAARGYTVHRVRPYDFAAWMRATERYARLAEKARGDDDPTKRQPFTFKPLWSVLKDVLLDDFHGKCAYCDATLEHVAWGDVEHFRPKAEVTEDASHPGYYWLAYDPDNYLPSCQKCNQGDAKKNRFPVSGTRARRPTDSLAAENADLLTPHEMRQEISYEPSTHEQSPGWAKPRNGSRRAEVSIQVYRLNRRALADVRLSAQRQARMEYRQAYANWLMNDIADAKMRVEEECRAGLRQFAAAAIAEIEDFLSSKNLPSPF